MAAKNRINPTLGSSLSSSNSLTPTARLRSNNRSTNQSNSSLTQSDLNVAIMDMLNINSEVRQCRQICVGNPITMAGQRKQMGKMLAVVLLPLLVLTVMTAVNFSKSLSSYINTLDVIARIDFGVQLGDFLMALQKERDMSSLYLSKIGSETKTDLLLAYPETDSALDNLSSWPVSPSNTIREFQSRERYLNKINRHRYELDSVNTTVAQEIDFYSKDIEIFLKWMYDAVSEVDTGTIWKTLVGYQELIMASEFIGRERGFGIYFYATGSFRDREHFLLFIESQDTAKTFFESARMYSILASDVFEKNLETNNETLTVVQSMRREIRLNKSSRVEGSVELAKDWFSKMSVYRDVMRDTQIVLTEKINRLLDENSKDSITNMIIAGAIFAGIMIISPLIVVSVYKLTSNIQKYSLHIAKKTKALNKEKKQSEALLYQMLPKTVAEHLRQNGAVDAEQFQDCTIFQSDMVGFTRLSANSSALQVTEMLNALFTCFDERINIYDVYKVETVGDGYVVVSGVPRRNGVRHASEIATMSLDILYNVNKLELPQFPGEKYKLRVGCHSGPVVAGVVGSKNPRYCLFGSTVRTVALMESSCETNKIQISHGTYTLLTTIGGFEMEERQYDDVNIKDQLKKLGNSPRTYWLLRKEISDWTNGSSSSMHTDSMGSVQSIG